jgi:WD40 repeat protein
MTAVQRNTKYFVVGGPVQPDRPCYIVRDADAVLYTRLSEGDYCKVLAPHHTGKTSLIAHTAARLRLDGFHVAIIDLAQISQRDMSDDPGRWYYSIAYRIVRELRIRSDMQTWWQERSALTNMQRLREFFLEVVLADANDRFVIFIDHIEEAIGRAMARELFGAIRACYDGRAIAPEYQRLTFALLGSATVGQLGLHNSASPFAISTAISLSDCDREEMRQLAAGLPYEAAAIDRVSDRAWYWTSGHPYLSQKVFRALLRRSGKAPSDDDVDDIVRALFMSKNAPREETHLSGLAEQLLRESSAKVGRLSLYGRLCKGGEVTSDRTSETHRDLLRSGIVAEDSGGNLVIRNRVYAGVFTARWVNHNLPFGWQGSAIAVMVVLFLLGVPVWYTEYLPKPYLRILNAPDQEFVTAQEAYRRLSILPGFGATADQLFSDYLARQSRDATRLPEVERYSQRLAEIPDKELFGRELIAEFWDRRAQQTINRGDRDTALLFATRALSIPTPERRALVAELMGSNFDNLLATIRTDQPLDSLEIDQSSGLITTLDERQDLGVWQLTDGRVRQLKHLQLVADEIIPLRRQLVFQGASAAARLRLIVESEHPRPSDIMVELHAPSGRQATVRLGQEFSTARANQYRVDSRRNPQLRSLLEGDVSGTWVAYFFDTRQGIGGNLLAWEMQLDGVPAAAPPGVSGESAILPESGVARSARGALAPGGQRALSWPAEQAVRGDVLVWSVAGNEVISRLPRPADFVTARFALGQSAVLIIGIHSVELWDADRGELLKSIPVDPALVPVLSENGQFMVVMAVTEETENALAVWDLDSLKEVQRLVTGGVARYVATDSTGHYLAVSDEDRLVRLWNVKDGKLVGEYEHAATPVSISFDPSGRWLATQDAGYTFRAWDLTDPGELVVMRKASSPWAANFSEQALFLGSLDRGFQVLGLPRGGPRGGIYHHDVARGREAPATYPGEVLIAAEHGIAVTFDGLRSVKIWGLPPFAEGDQRVIRQLENVSTTDSAISPSGRQLAIATGAGDIRFLSAGEQSLLLPGSLAEPGFIGHLALVTRVVFDQSGGLAASGSIDGSVRVWDTLSGVPRSFFVSHEDGAVSDVAFFPDSAQLVSASRRSVMVIDTDTGRLLAQAQIKSESPQLLVSRNGQQVYISGDHGGLSRWTWRTGALDTLLDSEFSIRRAALSADERFLATVDDQAQISLWDMQTMQAVGIPLQLVAAADHLWFSADGRYVLAQAGHWLNVMSVSVDGLDLVRSRLLEQAPAAVRPVEDSNDVLILTSVHTSTPILSRLAPMLPWRARIDGSTEDLSGRIETRISLTLNDWGEPEPLQ